MKILDMKTLDEYQEQHHSIQKTPIVFLDPPRKACNIRSIFMEQSGNVPFLYAISPERCFGTFPEIPSGIFSKDTENISRKRSTNILQTYICPVGKHKLQHLPKPSFMVD